MTCNINEGVQIAILTRRSFEEIPCVPIRDGKVANWKQPLLSGNPKQHPQKLYMHIIIIIYSASMQRRPMNECCCISSYLDVRINVSVK